MQAPQIYLGSGTYFRQKFIFIYQFFVPVCCSIHYQ